MRKLALIALAVAIPAAAIAQDAAKKTVEARQGYFKLMGANMDTLAGMAKGEIEYSAEGAQTAADNMAALVSYNRAHLFAPGTSSDDVEGSRALPKIWEDMAGVGEKGAAHTAAVENMQGVAGSGQAEMAGALEQLGGSCKGCHDNYRAK